jgi:DNA-binding transcriptional ArsR family regulator
MDEVFRALGDPTRRTLLDELFREDGQTLGALEARLPLTRFGVMKHLRVLEKAGLVVTKRRGREKLHFLNPVPIRLVHDRWVSKYAAPWAAALSDLKRDLENMTMEKVFVIYIKTTPERLWHAITDFEMRRKYTFGVGVKSDWTVGSHYEGISESRRRRSSKARSSKSIRPANSCRVSARTGATTRKPRARRA